MSKLDPFRHLLGKVPDKKLSSMAGVPVQAIRTARKAAGLSEPGEGPTPEQAVPEAAPEPSLEDLGDTSPSAIPDASSSTRQEPCPPCIIVTRNRQVLRAPPRGYPREFGYGDVFGSGDVAIRDWLWEHHRDIVTHFMG